MRYSKFILLSILVLFFISNAFSQNAKKLSKTAEDFYESKKYSDAVEYFNKAIEADANYEDAFVGRAKAYEKMYNYKKALDDYSKLCVLNDKEEDYFYNKARLQFLLKDYKEAIKSASAALELDKKHLGAFDIKINSLIAIDQIKEAKQQAINAIDAKKTFQTFYNRAKTHYLLEEYDDAVYYYTEAIDEDDEKVDGYIGLSESYYMKNDFDECLHTIEKGFTQDSKNKELYIIRAKCNVKKIEYQKAINDLSKVITLYPNDKKLYNIYLQRGKYYFDFNQHINAINDFNKALELNPNLVEAYFNRAASYEVIRDYDAAIADYEKLNTFELDTKKMQDLLEEATKRLFELKREDNKPEIVFEKPQIRNEGELEFIKDLEIGKISGKINDESEIKSVKVNGNRVLLDSSSSKNLFNIEIDLKDKKEVSFVVTDVYDNVLSKTYKIIRTEVEPPKIMLVTPFASDDGQIYLESEDPNIFIEGNIMDDSKIKEITIDGVRASFIPDNLNPTFTATFDITNKNKITFRAEDIYGNIEEKTFLINRQIADINQTNPMGKTWVVFIENSSYKTFASLSGPTKDVTMMKSALSKYQIHNIIHKKDLSKDEMEKFFSIQLRDLIRKNRVNSIVVWYAGHGKFINNTGYWIPVDARRDDEFTYFNIGNLKSSMQSYSDVVTHTLVITDACESGPTFYQAMRSDLQKRDCSDWTATKLKSSQVFSSAGYELASDNSQFTKTFSNSLIHNPNSCIPIESIVQSVTESVTESNQQKPQFGKIDGMEDENGTFFFIKK